MIIKCGLATRLKLPKYCNHGKYRGWNGSTVEISCWADLPQPLAGIKNSPKNLCSHVIFIVFFKFEIEIVGGDGINPHQLELFQ